MNRTSGWSSIHTSLVVAALVMVAHGLVIFFPAYAFAGAPDLRLFTGIVWAVQGTTLGALLIALIFILTALQQADPPRAALDEVIHRLRLPALIGFSGGSVAATGLGLLMQMPASGQRPFYPPGLAWLPILDLILLVAGVVGFLWIATEAPGYIHKRAMVELTTDRARKLTRAITLRERAAKQALPKINAEAKRLFPISSANFAEAVSRQRAYVDEHEQRLRPARADVREMQVLQRELNDRADAALRADDTSYLLLITEAWKAIIAEYCDTRRLAGSEKHPQAWDNFNGDYCVDEFLDFFTELCRKPSMTMAPRCADELITLPFSIWRTALAGDVHEVVGVSLTVAVDILFAGTRPGDAATKLWLEIWRNWPAGPEETVTRDFRRALRPKGVTTEEVLHRLQTSLQIQDALFQAVALSFAKNDPLTARHLVASLSTMDGAFWPIADPAIGFSQELRDALKSTQEQADEGLRLVIALASIRFLADNNYRVVLDELIDSIATRPWWLSDPRELSSLQLAGPKWFTEYISKASPPTIQLEGREQDVSTFQLHEIALVILGIKEAASSERRARRKISLPDDPDGDDTKVFELCFVTTKSAGTSCLAKTSSRASNSTLAAANDSQELPPQI